MKPSRRCLVVAPALGPSSLATAVGALGVAFIGALVAGCAKPAPTTTPSTVVKVAVVEQAGATAGTRYSAQIEPATRVDLAFKVGGYIDAVTQAPGLDGKPRLMQEGDAVRSGMALARLRTTDYQQKLGEASAAMAQAKVGLDQAQMDLDRVTKLADSGAVPIAERDAQKTRRDSAAAQYTGARVRVDEAQTALADTVLRSPLTGVVLKRNIEVGALAGPGLVGFSVADVGSVKAVYGVPDTALPRVRLGATQIVTTEAYPGVRFTGRISRIAPSADPRSRVFEVELSIPNDDGRLKPGMVAALALEVGADAAAKSEPLVPLSAIVRSPGKGGFAVYVVTDAGGKKVAHARDVELGEYLGRVIPVRQGLAGGETIVVQGAGLLSDGEPVQVIPVTSGGHLDPGDGGSHPGGSHEEKELIRDRAMVATKRNTARYFTEHRHVAWVALVATLVWGVYGYVTMPKAKDPTVEVRVAVASCAWPGAEAQKVEELVTRKIEQKLGESAAIEKIESISRTSVSIVYVTLKENVADRVKEWDGIAARLDSIHDLPDGAGPINFQRDFGDTATLMLTVASPKVSDVELELRTRAVQRVIETVRAGARTTPEATRATLIVSFPADINVQAMKRLGDQAELYFDELPGTRDARRVESPGFLGIDVATTLDDNALRLRLRDFAEQRLRLSELHPDVWRPAVIRDPKEAQARLAEVAGDRYSYRELDQFTDQIQRYLQRVPVVSKVTRTGVLKEQIYLEYSQERLASNGVQPGQIGHAISARNITAPGGILEVGGKNVSIDPSGQFASERDIADVVVARSSKGAPVYLRDLVDVSRDYQSPARFLNYLTARDAHGHFVRSRAITLAVNMRRGEQIGDFAVQVDRALAVVGKLLPEDLILRRTSDQPLQVRESVSLFMKSLYEAIALVVVVALIGFWEWRTALLLALCIPITLAMTFGLMRAVGIDIQQISIASLIIALGLLIDDPVVASDAIKHSLAAGWKARVAAWLGPTKLAAAIMFATVTNIAAYLPFLTLPGDTGVFIYSLPVVLSLSLVASRIVSMTFVPLLGSALLRPPKKKEPTAAERRSRGFGRVYYSVVGWAIDHRIAVFVASLVLLAGAGVYGSRVKPAFFPKDLSYLSYVDIWLPEDATLSATRDKASEAETLIQQACLDFARAHGEGGGPLLESITEFIGGGGPRFWFSVSPELQQLNYAQLVIQIRDKEETRYLVPYLQQRLSSRIAGARIDVRQLETGKPVGVPVAVRLSGENIDELRRLAEQAKAIFRATPGTERVRDDWGADTFAVRLEVDPDRANLAGISNLDVARSSAVAMNGAVVGQLREGDREINLVTRLRAEERAQIGDVENLYVYSQGEGQKVPLGQVSRVTYSLQTEKIRRRNQFRTITVSAFPAAGLLPSEVTKRMQPKIDALAASLPAGYQLELGGEAEEQVKSFRSLVIVLLMLLAAIYLALVLQFKNAVKPFVVFAALPYGGAAALVALVVTGAPFSFMAFLGVISLMGVIVSHVIVLFDFIEEMHERGEPMREALLDAGLMRLRPVLITVVATVLGLIPLAAHGGPLWQPLCYAQIGGLSFATVVTLLLVPVLYTIVIKDLKWIRWEKEPAEADEIGPAGGP